jgi:hypothetical protein
MKNFNNRLKLERGIFEISRGGIVPPNFHIHTYQRTGEFGQKISTQAGIQTQCLRESVVLLCNLQGILFDGH